MPRASDYGAKILLEWVGWCPLPPKRYLQPNFQKLGISLYGKKKVFENVIKDLEMRSFWMTHVGPNPSDKGPYKRHTEEAL